jgi:hypothetical protein
MRWAGHVARTGEKGGAGGKLKKRQLGRPRYGWEDDIKKYLKQIGWRAWAN